MSAEKIILIRDAVREVCHAIDAGEITTEQEMLAFAEVVQRHGGPLSHDLVCQLASRCRIGHKALDDCAS